MPLLCDRECRGSGRHRCVTCPRGLPSDRTGEGLANPFRSRYPCPRRPPLARSSLGRSNRGHVLPAGPRAGAVSLCAAQGGRHLDNRARRSTGSPHTRAHAGGSAYLLDEAVLFTGDTLFVDGVGRPDLEADPAEAKARAQLLYRSLRRLLALSGDVWVMPGHSARPLPFDGQPVGASLAELRQRVGFLAMDEESFVTSILQRIPPTPPNHHSIVQANESGAFPTGDVTDLEAGANRCAVS